MESILTLRWWWNLEFPVILGRREVWVTLFGWTIVIHPGLTRRLRRVFTRAERGR